MFWIKMVFWAGIVVTFYSYIGYGIFIWLILKLRALLKPAATNFPAPPFTPPVTLIIAAYNEEDFIRQKIENTLALTYPDDALHLIFITDGSTDQTPEILKQYPRIQLLHSEARQGKVAAMHRAMAFVKTPMVVFSDANTLLNKDSIANIVKHYQNPKVGGVAGEKKIMQSGNEAAAGAGEGLYWKYESFLKKLDWQFYTVVGAAGELFSIRTELYEYPGDDILLDDFIISLRVCQKGYRVAYEANAFALETASSSIKEEQKRKIRISAGGFQSMYLLRGLLNFFKYPLLSFQYISHRVLRWTLCPLFLPLVLLCNMLLVTDGASFIYKLLLAAQVIFYSLAIAGWLLSLQNKKVSFLYAPYYFVFINVSLYFGFVRFLKGQQTVLWEKAARAKHPATESMS
ncbi:MAG TPA: glycosyltransferase family 2 protein [Chitinophagaceae bacterium]|nr:glycosyltransferase family 2 protein [Chitinophagaceae bacterium]